MRRAGWVSLWAALVLAAWGLAPPTRSDVWAWCLDLVAGRWEGTDPLVVAHFQLMGVWPLVFAVQLRGALRARPVPLWPFVLGSGLLGAFVLLPGLALQSGTAPDRDGPVERALGSGVFRGLVGAGALLWMGWGAAWGSPGAWEAARASDGFVWTMTWDFCALWSTSAALACERAGWRVWCFVPMLGGLVAAAATQRPVDDPAGDA